MDETHAVAATEAIIIAEQARKVRALYPELFAALDQRDRQLRRVVQRLPEPYDPESWLPLPTLEQTLQSLRTLGAGIGQLCQPVR